MFYLNVYFIKIKKKKIIIIVEKNIFMYNIDGNR